MPGYIVNKLCF